MILSPFRIQRSQFTIRRSPFTLHSLPYIPAFRRDSSISEGGYDIQTVEELRGHNDIKTTMTYTHVPNRGPAGVGSPGDALRRHCGGFYADPHKTP